MGLSIGKMSTCDNMLPYFIGKVYGPLFHENSRNNTVFRGEERNLGTVLARVYSGYDATYSVLLKAWTPELGFLHTPESIYIS